MSAAAAVARDTARRLTPDHADYAWACNATGRALHFTSQEEAFQLLELALTQPHGCGSEEHFGASLCVLSLSLQGAAS
jgi:hypothetical protein